MSADPPRREGLADSVRRVGSSMLNVFHTRLEILSTELVRAMQLCGARSPAEIGAHLLCRNS